MNSSDDEVDSEETTVVEPVLTEEPKEQTEEERVRAGIAACKQILDSEEWDLESLQQLDDEEIQEFANYSEVIEYAMEKDSQNFMYIPDILIMNAPFIERLIQQEVVDIRYIPKKYGDSYEFMSEHPRLIRLLSPQLSKNKDLFYKMIVNPGIDHEFGFIIYEAASESLRKDKTFLLGFLRARLEYYRRLVPRLNVRSVYDDDEDDDLWDLKDKILWDFSRLALDSIVHDGYGVTHQKDASFNLDYVKIVLDLTKLLVSRFEEIPGRNFGNTKRSVFIDKIKKCNYYKSIPQECYSDKVFLADVIKTNPYIARFIKFKAEDTELVINLIPDIISKHQINIIHILTLAKVGYATHIFGNQKYSRELIAAYPKCIKFITQAYTVNNIDVPKELYMYACDLNGMCVKYVPRSYHSKEIAMVSLKFIGKALKYIAEWPSVYDNNGDVILDYGSLEFILAAMKTGLSYLKYADQAKLLDIDFSLKILEVYPNAYSYLPRVIMPDETLIKRFLKHNSANVKLLPDYLNLSDALVIDLLRDAKKTVDFINIAKGLLPKTDIYLELLEIFPRKKTKFLEILLDSEIGSVSAPIMSIYGPNLVLEKTKCKPVPVSDPPPDETPPPPIGVQMEAYITAFGECGEPKDLYNLVINNGFASYRYGIMFRSFEPVDALSTYQLIIDHIDSVTTNYNTFERFIIDKYPRTIDVRSIFPICEYVFYAYIKCAEKIGYYIKNHPSRIWDNPPIINQISTILSRISTKYDKLELESRPYKKVKKYL